MCTHDVSVKAVLKMTSKFCTFTCGIVDVRDVVMVSQMYKHDITVL